MSQCFKKTVGIITILVSVQANAFCFDEAGARFDINPLLLQAISYTESRLNPAAVNDSNGNGTVDYGLMQINSSWFGRLERKGISSEQIKTDPCINVMVGAWILAKNFETSGESWQSVGAYNAGYKKENSKSRDTYIALVKGNLERMQQWQE
jgi:soluble lytic murein transglycosylase-like protein